MNMKTRILAAGAAAALLLGTANAQPGAMAGHNHMRSDGFQAQRGLEGRRMAGSRIPGLRLLRDGLPFGVPIGTEIEARFYAEEPAEGVEPTTTLTLIVGEDSEAAFLEDVAAAREDATYLVVEIGEQLRSIDLPDAASEDGSQKLRGRPAAVLGMLHHAGLEDGDTITAVFYDGDPEAGGSVLETLDFTYGEDSAIGFQQDVLDAAETADWVAVTLPPRSYTVDLAAVAERDGMRPSVGRFGPGRSGSGSR